MNEGNRRNLVELNTDLVRMLQIRHCNVGLYKATKYFMQNNVKRLAWSAKLFNDGKVELYCEKKVDSI
jgi:hypothetical protein